MKMLKAKLYLVGFKQPLTRQCVTSA